MTMHIYQRCTNCHDIYDHYVSGGPFPSISNEDYCPICYETVCNALKTIPPKRKEIWAETDEITLDQVKMAIKIEKSTSFLGMHKVAAPLFDMNNSDNHNITGYVKIDNKEYLYSYWTQKDDVSIRKKWRKLSKQAKSLNGQNIQTHINKQSI